MVSVSARSPLREQPPGGRRIDQGQLVPITTMTITTTSEYHSMSLSFFKKMAAIVIAPFFGNSVFGVIKTPFYTNILELDISYFDRSMLVRNWHGLVYNNFLSTDRSRNHQQ